MRPIAAKERFIRNKNYVIRLCFAINSLGISRNIISHLSPERQWRRAVFKTQS